ncbi:MAG: peptidoglycan -binding protein [Sphingomonadales bacterium]
MSWRLSKKRAPDAGLGWPGFVDALSSLLLVIIFLLSVFALAQFFLGQALSGRDEALAALQRDLGRLSDLLAMEKASNESLEAEIAALSASLADSRAQNQDLSADLSAARARIDQARADQEAAEIAIAELSRDKDSLEQALVEEKIATAKAQEEIARMNRNLEQLRAQLASLQQALEASEAKDERQEAIIADLGKRLNTALAGKVAELVTYRSEFFGRLREVLGDRDDILIQGDRFIFQSEVLFDSGSAALKPGGQEQLLKFANVLKDIAPTFPPGLDWILRIDGHTDRHPISTPQYPSNWELSVARALSVLRFLRNQGIPPERLAAAGFGQYQPIASGDSPVVDRLNRRIELRLDQR